MARVARLAGALLVETRSDFFLVGNLKEPCDWATAGFEPPPDGDALSRPFVRLCPVRPVRLAPPLLALEAEGEALARLLAERMLVRRTGSVSERLWRLVIGEDEKGDRAPGDLVEARWLGEVPAPVWEIVRDAVLRCS
ncbi:MAG: hypothetical protein L0216_04090 [Planctomycetales bacterium]|nr:hypothetical protein [Planctomycetales bacterium]